LRGVSPRAEQWSKKIISHDNKCNLFFQGKQRRHLHCGTAREKHKKIAGQKRGGTLQVEGRFSKTCARGRSLGFTGGLLQQDLRQKRRHAANAGDEEQTRGKKKRETVLIEGITEKGGVRLVPRTREARAARCRCD